MKQKRTFVTLLLVVALLCLGIAYAAVLSIDLRITGEALATASDENFEVKFIGTPTTTTEVASETIEATVEAGITGDRVASIGCSGLTTKGDYVTATYTIENASPELTAYLKAEATCTNSVFDVATSLKETSIAATDGTDTTELTVTITLNETVAADTKGDVTVTLTAASVQPTAEPTTTP